LSDRLLRGDLPGAPRQSGPGTIAGWVSSHGIEYTSTDDKDQDRVYSGRVYLPTFWRRGPVKVPLVVYVHGTELDRKEVPFFNRGPEAMIGALAAVREAQTNPFYRDLSLTAAACMGGPFQLSKSIRHLLTDGATPYERPYVQALLLHAYHDLYPEMGLFDPVGAFHPELLVDRRTGAVDDGNLLRWLDGSLNGEQITRRIKLRLKGDAQAPLLAREVLNTQWVETHHLADAWPDTPVAKVLRENDLVGGWVPRIPILLASSPHDECVPAANSAEAKREWLRLGCEAKVHLCPLTWEGSRLNHEKGAMMGLATALGWIRTYHWPMAGSLFELWVGPEDPLREAAWNFHSPR
jgi:hypothetical protein